MKIEPAENHHFFEGKSSGPGLHVHPQASTKKNHVAIRETQHQTITSPAQSQPMQHDGVTTDSFHLGSVISDSAAIKSQLLSSGSNSTADSTQLSSDLPHPNNSNPQTLSVGHTSVPDSLQTHTLKPVWRIWGFEVLSISVSYLIFVGMC